MKSVLYLIWQVGTTVGLLFVLGTGLVEFLRIIWRTFR